MDYLALERVPPGLQIGYFLARAGRDYQIPEAHLDPKNAIALLKVRSQDACP